MCRYTYTQFLQHPITYSILSCTWSFDWNHRILLCITRPLCMGLGMRLPRPLHLRSSSPFNNTSCCCMLVVSLVTDIKVPPFNSLSMISSSVTLWLLITSSCCHYPQVLTTCLTDFTKRQLIWTFWHLNKICDCSIRVYWHNIANSWLGTKENWLVLVLGSTLEM